jgi:hypothetical protein
MLIEITDSYNSVMLDLDSVLWIMQITEKKETWFSKPEKEKTIIHYKNEEEMECRIRYDVVRKALDKFCPLHIKEGNE